MGRAKETLFGPVATSWPTLERAVQKGALLSIDLAYARLQKEALSESKAATHALTFAFARKGHLALMVGEEITPPLSELTKDPLLQENLASLLAKGTYQLSRNQVLEEKIVERIKHLFRRKLSLISSHVEKSLTDEQKRAVHSCLAHPLTFLTGGPGTGKTTTARAMIRAFQAGGKERCIACAPTGKAATHLERILTKEGALIGTLHSLLDWRIPLAQIETTSPLEADLIIVDEASMLDPSLFLRLLYAVGDETTLVLMGDANQLSAVEGGSLFADLLDAMRGEERVTSLTQSHRTDREAVLTLATTILEGKSKDIRTIDLGFGERNREKIYEKIYEYVRAFYSGEHSFQLLSTLRKGPFGVDALNQFLYEKFAEEATHLPILITKNAPTLGLSNGEIGVLEPGKGAHFSDGRFVEEKGLPKYEWAYCLSVHKSQGSEYDHVLLLVPEGSEAFGREVLYTAVTRARHRVDVDGSQDEILSALSRSSRKTSTLCGKV